MRRCAAESGGAYIWQNGYDAHLTKVGDSIAGFALIGSAAEWLGDMDAHDVHEFFVIRRFRRSGVGQRVATLLWKERPGEWLVRVLEANAHAVLFWRTAIASHSRGRYEEEGASSTDVPGDSSGSYPMAPDHTLQPSRNLPGGWIVAQRA